jgi:hypothetical protein
VAATPIEPISGAGGGENRAGQGAGQHWRNGPSPTGTNQELKRKEAKQLAAAMA